LRKNGRRASHPAAQSSLFDQPDQWAHTIPPENGIQRHVGRALGHQQGSNRSPLRHQDRGEGRADTWGYGDGKDYRPAARVPASPGRPANPHAHKLVSPKDPPVARRADETRAIIRRMRRGEEQHVFLRPVPVIGLVGAQSNPRRHRLRHCGEAGALSNGKKGPIAGGAAWGWLFRAGLLDGAFSGQTTVGVFNERGGGHLRE